MTEVPIKTGWDACPLVNQHFLCNDQLDVLTFLGHICHIWDLGIYVQTLSPLLWLYHSLPHEGARELSMFIPSLLDKSCSYLGMTPDSA